MDPSSPTTGWAALEPPLIRFLSEASYVNSSLASVVETRTSKGAPSSVALPASPAKLGAYEMPIVPLLESLRLLLPSRYVASKAPKIALQGSLPSVGFEFLKESMATGERRCFICISCLSDSYDDERILGRTLLACDTRGATLRTFQNAKVPCRLGQCPCHSDSLVARLQVDEDSTRDILVARGLRWCKLITCA
jgi:hypothetical protein